MKTVYYIVDVWGVDYPDIDEALEFKTDRDIHDALGFAYDRWEVEWLIEEICKHYFHNHDGWEMEKTWRDGIVVALWDDDKNFVGKFTSQLEYEPTFSVYKVEE